MNFQVPQFIEVEDKIFGPLTFKQFAYVAGGAGACFIVYTYTRNISIILSFVLMIPVAAVFFSLAFYKINGRPAIVTFEAAFKYALARKLFLWKKSRSEMAKPTIQTTEVKPGVAVPRLSESKLKDLSWSLDINENIRS